MTLLLGSSIDITPEIKARRRIFEIIDAVQMDNPHIFATRPAFDGKKNIYSFKPLFPGGQDGVFSCKPEGAINDFTVTIRLVAQVESEYLFPSNDPYPFLMQWPLVLLGSSLVEHPQRQPLMCPLSSRLSYHNNQICKLHLSKVSLLC